MSNLTRIPKILHCFYDNIDVWQKGKNPLFTSCYYSWKRFCPDYKIIVWHDQLPEVKEFINNSFFIKKAYELKLWAFVSDYIRLCVLEKYGGIYLDTDVQLIGNFDSYLNNGFFASIEGFILYGKNIIEPAIMGGVANHIIFKETKKIYESQKIFDYDYYIAPVIIGTTLEKICNFSRIKYSDDISKKEINKFYDPTVHTVYLDNIKYYYGARSIEYGDVDVHIYPSEYFCPDWDLWKEQAFTSNTVSIHWNQSSWWNNNMRKLLSYKYRSCIKRWLFSNKKRIIKWCSFWILKKDLRNSFRKKISKLFDKVLDF